MNGRFDALEERSPILVQEQTQQRVAAVGRYCSSTSPTSGGLCGYRGVKLLCEAACLESDVRICFGHELSLGADLPAAGGFYSSGAWVERPSPANTTFSDCDGWTSSEADTYGALWNGAQERPTSVGCDVPNPVLCCC